MARVLQRKKRTDNSVFGQYFNTQITGIGYVRVGQLPDHIIDDVREKEDTEVVVIISELDAYSVDKDFNSQECMNTLKQLLNSLTSYEARRTQDEQVVEEDQNRCAEQFIEFGGVEVLIRLLMYSSLLPESSSKNRDNELCLRVKSLCLEVFSRLITTKIGESLSRDITKNDDILDYLFTLMVHDKTYLVACNLIEDLLQARRSVFNLHRIYNLPGLLTCMDDKKLSNFCRILALTISDLDIYENKSSLFAQNKQKRSKGFINNRDINQEMLLGMPDLLPRLISIACAKNYTPRYRGMNSELDCWMEWIENSMADAVFETPVVDDLEEFIGGISEAVTAGGPMTQQSGLRISTEVILRVEVVYVLGLFLVGKHRKKVQRKLAELKLVPGLSDLFDQFIWKCQVHRNNSRHRLRGHNASCECSPEVALKIQFLRLVHSFCDHSDYKHLLLSRGELSEIKRINSKAGVLSISGLDQINKQLMCRGSKGLLTKIVEVMKKEPTASTFRFWLARAVESYLRGSTSFCDQVFLLRRGLLQHIAGNIVDHDIRHPKEILQSSFDLLGELIKFNIDAFKAFDKVLNTQDRFDKFVSTVNKNLVDSNMFIRSLVLSLEHFMTTQPSYTDYAKRDSRLLLHIANFDTQLQYLQRLINTINVDNLTQENVSCLNTTLVFLMFSNQKNKLPQYLRALNMQRAMHSECSATGSVIMKNFRDLLTFWQDHYLHKDKDCSALEKSSRISFEYWKETVSTLVSDDRNQENALIHYIPSDSYRDN